MICSKSKLDPELGKLRLILLENGYSEHAINSAFKRKLQQLNSNLVHTVEKCPVYLYIPWIGNILMKFEKQITSAVKRCFFSIEPRVIFNTRQLLPAIKKDVLPSHHHSNVIYQFVCHCNSRYVGRTSQHLEERIKQHVPRSIANPPALPNCQSLSHSCKANTCPQQFYKSSSLVNIFLTMPNALFTTATKNFLFLLKVALFTFLLLKQLSLNLSIPFCASKKNLSTL